MNTDDPIWQPTPLRIADANLTRYLAHRADRGQSASDYSTLWQWSVDDPEAFWLDWLEYSGVVYEGETRPVLVDRERMPGARWFPSLRLNYAENLLRRSGPEPPWCSATRAVNGGRSRGTACARRLAESRRA